MNSIDPERIDLLASLLERTFVVNNFAYAEQIANGTYKTVYSKLGVQRIRQMIAHSGACLTYQSINKQLQWVCFDIDIKKECLERSDYGHIRDEARKEVERASSKLSIFLKQHSIPHLLEFSGNRGAHIWIKWEGYVSRSTGFLLVQTVLAQCKPLENLHYASIDCFPPKKTLKGRLGRGVKLPLSLHKKSQSYALLLESTKKLGEHFQDPLKELTNAILDQQIKILEAFIPLAWSALIKKLSFESDLLPEAHKIPFVKQGVLLPQGITLDDVINDLSRCSVIKPLFEKYRSDISLNEQDRTVIVALINRLTSWENPKAGRDMLVEFFKRLPNYKPELTLKKLSNLNLYPPVCEFLKSTYKKECLLCLKNDECEVEKSPIELIEGCTIQSENVFHLSAHVFDILRQGCIRYAKSNDEIDLYFLKREFQLLDTSATCESFQSSLIKPQPLGHFYRFSRTESESKTRQLYSLSPYDAVLSSWYSRILNGLFEADFSENAFGYRFEPSLTNNNLFRHWFPQWKRYTKALGRIIEDNAFDAHYVVKLDVKSFYDSIPHARLRLKLEQGPTRSSQNTLNALDDQSRKNYINICSTLLSWCALITNNDCGVPQGPAFARVLAELYLLQFDQTAEDHIAKCGGHYFRWVDDIFLIVPTKQHSNEISAALRKELHALSLEVNEQKAFQGTVRDYRSSFRLYSDQAKYFVDQVARNPRASSTFRIAQANEALNDIIEYPDGLGVRTENAAFFITHQQTSGERSLDDQFSEFIGIEFGRGSYFHHLFEEVVSAWAESEYQTLPELHFTPGLRLDVFLNCVLSHISTTELNTDQSHRVVLHLRKILPLIHSDLAKEIYVHIALTAESLTPLLNSEDVSLDILLRCLSGNKEVTLPIDLVSRILEALANKALSQQIYHLSIVAFRNCLSREGYSLVSDRYFDLVLERLSRGTRRSYFIEPFDSLSEEQLLQHLHLLTCFCSLTGSQKNDEQLKQVWRLLIELTNAVPQWVPAKSTWLSKADEVTVDITTATTLIAAVIDGDGLVPGLVDLKAVFSTYHNQLLLFLFASSTIATADTAITIDALIATAKREKKTYLEWIIATPDSVRLFPNKQVCLKNIVENNLIVLKKGQQLLVRYSTDCIFISRPPFPPTLDVQREDPPTFENKIYSYPTATTNVSALIASQDTLIGLIRICLSLYQSLEEFSGKYVGLSGRIPNIFTDGLSIDQNTFAAILPETALCSSLLIERAGTIEKRDNSLDEAWSFLMTQITSSGLRLHFSSHITQCLAEDMRKILPANSSASEQKAFLTYFVEALGASNRPSFVNVDRAKFIASTVYAQWFISRGTPTNSRRQATLFGKALQTYLEVSGEPGMAAARMSLNASSASDHTLADFLATIASALSWTGSDIFFNGALASLLPSFRREIISLCTTVNSHQPIDAFPTNWSLKLDNEDRFFPLDHFLRPTVSSSEAHDLFINGRHFSSLSAQVDTPKPIWVIRFGSFSHRVEHLKPQHIGDLRRGLIYWSETDTNVVIILLDDLLRALYEIISYRVLLATKTEDATVSRSELECIVVREDVSDRTRRLPTFDRAVMVIKDNHRNSNVLRTKSDCEDHLLRWLNQFDEPSANALTEVVAAHQTITTNDITAFLHNVRSNTDSVAFVPKRISDIGGVHRLFGFASDGASLERQLALETAVDRICDNVADGTSTLFILSEVILSGSQLSTALKVHYLSAYDPPAEEVTKQRWYSLGIQRSAFLSGIKRFARIHILTTAYTEFGFSRVVSVLKEGVGISPSALSISGRKLPDAECFFGTCTKISAIAKYKIRSIVSDTSNMSLLFKDGHKLSQATLDKANLLVRPNSVPKRALGLFTATPTNNLINPLFHRIDEHSE